MCEASDSRDEVGVKILRLADHVFEVGTGKTRFITTDPIEAQVKKRAPPSLTEARRRWLISAR